MNHKRRTLLTPDEACDILKITKATLYRWSHEGRIPKIKPSSRCLRFDLEDIYAFLDGSYQEAKQAGEPING